MVDITIDTKLRIAGVEATGTFDAGTLKFKVDSSALKQLVTDAGKAADAVRKKFNNIKLNKLKIELNQSSLRTLEKQIRNAVSNAVSSVNVSVGRGGGGDPFKAQRDAANKAATSLSTLHQLTVDVNRGLRSLAATLTRFSNMGPVGGGGGAAAGTGTIPLPPGATSLAGAPIGQQVASTNSLQDAIDRVNAANARRIAREREGRLEAERAAAVFARTERERLRRVQQLTKELDALLRREQQLGTKISAAGGGPGAPVIGGGGLRGGFGGGGGGRFGAGAAGGGGDSGFGGPTSIQKLAQAMNEVTSSTKRANVEMDELEQLAFTVGRKAATFRGVAIAINTVVNAAQGAAKFIIQYTDSLIELNKILQASDEGLRVVGDKLFALSASTGAAVDETVSIATEFARAGLEGRGYGSVVELTTRAIEGMQGTSLDANQATEIMIQTIQQLEGGARGLNKELITSSRLFDILGKAEDITASKASDVQDAFQRSLGSLAATGATMEELVAIISVVQERTQRGGDVIGTAFKTLTSRIASSTSEASKALNDIGVKTVQADGKLRSITDILADTSHAFESLSEAEQANISVAVAGIRQIEIFRAAMLDWSRIQEVTTANQNAQGDAARKAKLEQDKLATTITRMTTSLQQLVKTAAESGLGQLFAFALKLADGLLSVMARLDKSAGGFISTFASGSIIIGAFKALKPIINGIFKAFQFFVSSTHEVSGNMSSLNSKAGQVGATINTGMNTALQTTASIMVQLNAEMDRFNAKQSLAADQMAKNMTRREATQRAIDIATRQLGAERKGQPSQSDVLERAGRIMERHRREDPNERSRSFAILAAEQSGRGHDLAKAARDMPGQFDAGERRRIAAMEKDVSRSQTRIGAGLSAITKSLTVLANHPIMTSVGFSLLAGGLDKLADATGSTTAKILSSAAQFAGLGALFGPMGIAVGGLLGGLGSLVSELTTNRDSVKGLTKAYVQLGLVQTQNGELTVEAAKKIDQAFKNIEALRNFNSTLERKQLADAEKARRQAAGITTGEQTPEERAKLRGEATAAFRQQTGSKLDLTEENLGAPGTPSALEINEKVLNSAVEAWKSLFPTEESKAAFQKRMDTIVSNIPISTPADILKDMAQDIGNARAVFLKELSEQLGNVGEGRENNAFFSAIEDLASGVVSEFNQKILDRAVENAARGIGPQTKGGAKLSANEIESMVGRAKQISAEAAEIKQGGPTRNVVAMRRLQDMAPRALDIARQQDAENRARALRETAAARSAETRRGIGDIGLNNAKSVAKGVLQPIDKLQNSLREFIASFENEIMRLEEATINATTPQKQLTKAMAEFTEKEFQNAKRQADLVKTDAARSLRELGEQLPDRDKRLGFKEGTDIPLLGLTKEQAEKMGTVGDVATKFIEGLIAASDTIREKHITDPAAQRELLSQALPSEDLAHVLSKEFIESTLKATKDFIETGLKADVNTAGTKAAKDRAAVEDLKFNLSEQEKDISLARDRRAALAESSKAAIEELTGIRQLVATRALESRQAQISIAETQGRIAGLEKLMAAEEKVLTVNKDDKAAIDKLAILKEEHNKQTIALEQQLGEERIAIVRNTIAVAQEAISAGQREAEFQKALIAGHHDLANLLNVGETQIEQFNRKLEQNSATFRQSMAALAVERAVVNETTKDTAEKDAKLADIRKRGILVAIESAKAEAQVIAERRAAIQQLVQEGLANQQEQVNAQKAVIDATKALSDAYTTYREAIQGAILATTQYNIGLRLAQVETIKLTGGFTGIKDEISAVSETFRASEKLAREMGASEKTLVDIRRQSIDAQLALFNQLLSQQSSLARSFFQSSAEDQASLFQGIQQAEQVASMLGGSFKNFQKLGEGAINDLGAQLLSLPQETRQQIVRSLETLGQLGGADVGGFTPDELLRAIETSALGVSKEGLDVDPLFEVQKRIAALNEQQARLATEQLISSQNAVEQAKQQLEEAQASKDLAEIQLERTKEEGAQIRGKIAELSVELRTVMLQQDATARNGFNMVAGVIGRSNDILTNILPDALSVRVADAVRNELATAKMTVPGVNAPPAPSATTPESRTTEMTQNMRLQGQNLAELNGAAGAAGNQLTSAAGVLGDKTNKQSNLPDSASAQETNSRLSDILSELKAIKDLSITSSETLTEISDSSGNVVGAASIGGTAAEPEINININGENRVTVTGFEAGVTRIATALSETFGGFATEADARAIAEEVVASIKRALVNLNILNRNELIV